jgi:hypothetical protein
MSDTFRDLSGGLVTGPSAAHGTVVTIHTGNGNVSGHMVGGYAVADK